MRESAGMIYFGAGLWYDEENKPEFDGGCLWK
jgi:hypothetical protein